MISEHNPRWMLLLAVLIHSAMAASIDWVAHIFSRGNAVLIAVMQGIAYLTYISSSWMDFRYLGQTSIYDQFVLWSFCH